MQTPQNTFPFAVYLLLRFFDHLIYRRHKGNVHVHVQGVPKQCKHILRDVIFVLLFVIVVVRRNQKCLDAGGKHFEHLLQ